MACHSPPGECGQASGGRAPPFFRGPSLTERLKKNAASPRTTDQQCTRLLLMPIKP